MPVLILQYTNRLSHTIRIQSCIYLRDITFTKSLFIAKVFYVSKCIHEYYIFVSLTKLHLNNVLTKFLLDFVFTWFCLYLTLFVPDFICTWFCLYLILAMSSSTLLLAMECGVYPVSWAKSFLSFTSVEYRSAWKYRVIHYTLRIWKCDIRHIEGKHKTSRWKALAKWHLWMAVHEGTLSI